ncbi:G-type lectin S-receptor-like serine/threonine-protein kinase [Actinidia chinensis var. chinensis]|uniref:Receptor-like serine/threonine-protein kinase n=1 Tax=Actinidia chinensis var. chinensis TaxID=1590841 RepID=A0A2R6RP34_ACTCC|nr:G-type lectin S-receptor-like serine/threonine-protein kinase [Actinidia chinensis var. chinensis]
MGSFLFILSIFLSCALVSGTTSSEFIYPNFTASNLQFIDNYGSFLYSRNGTFKASMFNPHGQQTNFYLCVIHVASNSITWSANHDAPVSSSGKMSLTADGILVMDQDGNFKWSTPRLQSLVSSLQLTENGNLVLLDQFNSTLWESFIYPTNTIVIGQKLHVGTLLSSAVSSGDLSIGSYRLTLSASDILLQWENKMYWKLSMDTNAFTESNYAVEYMEVTQTGLYLFGDNGSAVVIQVTLSPSDFRIAMLDDSGQFTVSSFPGTGLKQEFVGPVDKCQIPFICGRLGLCSDAAASDNPVCSCTPDFHLRSLNTTDCVPSDGSYSLSVSCNSTISSSKENSSMVSNLSLGYGIDYFANDFTVPVKSGVNLSVCQDLCSGDCSCLAVFYENSSGSCYALENELGSVMSSTRSDNDRLGFIKTLVGSSPTDLGGNNNFSGQALGFPVVALVLLPLTGFFLLVILGFLWWRRSRISRTGKVILSHPTSPSGDLEAFSIPGLPIRFDYVDLEVATDNFKTQIGAGGFGSVYKGTLPDKSLVAVKKITNVGVQGKKDFCTEIAIIGNIHHMNLVKLRGFCAQGRERLLVYEYMNRGSLDRTLFGNGPVLEWQERLDIALGTARGLAYLHSGCQQKIIHCDVKPENILLQDHFQAKISDFGLSKLLNSEQSGLFTTMRGTRGYLAPEWLTSSAISDKTDVYSFGMVLLEIVSGRKNCMLRTQSRSIDDDSSGGGSTSSSSRQGLVYFPLFALEMHEQGRYLELADPRLKGRVTCPEVEKLVRMALCCVHEEPALRPNMVNVVSMLEGEIPICQPRLESLNFLRFYGRRFSEASTREENNGQDDFMLYPQENASLASTNRFSPSTFSHVSSQQVSGPR